jgi:CRISPR-associated endoribonuclease Cas6
MLYSLVIQLTPESDVVLPATLGRHAHAALLGMMSCVDEGLARRVHDEKGEKPFTVSPLQGKFERAEKGQVRLEAGGEYWLRFTFLMDELYQAVSRFFLEAAPPTVRLGEGRFVVARVTATGEGGRKGEGEKGREGDHAVRSHPSSFIPHPSSWSGHATFEELWAKAQSREHLRMRFYSPTCFRVTRTPGRSEFVAEPSLWHCVQSWLNRWNRFAPLPLFFNRERLLDFVEACGHLRKARIETRMMDFGKYPQRGFVGSVEWVLSCERSMWFDGMQAEYLLKEIDALARFAFYCGTGYKTTMGLGQSRRVDGLQRKDAKTQR